MTFKIPLVTNTPHSVPLHLLVSLPGLSSPTCFFSTKRIANSGVPSSVKLALGPLLFFFFIYYYKIFITMSPSYPDKLKAGISPLFIIIFPGAQWCLECSCNSVCLLIYLRSLTHLSLFVLTSQSPTLKPAVNS